MPMFQNNTLWVLGLGLLLVCTLVAPCSGQSTTTLKLFEISNTSSVAFFHEGKQFGPSTESPITRGDTVVFNNDVFEYSSGNRGEKVAVSGGHGVFIDPAGKAVYYTWTYQFLTGDTLAFAGFNSSAIACIGGTGGYRGARGELAFIQTCTKRPDCEYVHTITLLV